MIFAIGIGIPAGAIAAVKRGSAYDHMLMGMSLTGYSMPIFWWGLLLIMFFSERSAGRRSRDASTSSNTTSSR